MNGINQCDSLKILGLTFHEVIADFQNISNLNLRKPTKAFLSFGVYVKKVIVNKKLTTYLVVSFYLR